jgi:hypothetical protein
MPPALQVRETSHGSTATACRAAVTDIRITLNDQTFTAQLADPPCQRPRRRPGTMDGVPAGDEPEINDIGYYAPSGDLVLYYGDVGYWNGIVRIGRLDAQDMSLIERQPDGFELTIDRG